MPQPFTAFPIPESVLFSSSHLIMLNHPPVVETSPHSLLVYLLLIPLHLDYCDQFGHSLTPIACSVGPGTMVHTISHSGIRVK